MHPDAIGVLAIDALLRGESVSLNLLIRARIINLPRLLKLTGNVALVKGLFPDESDERIKTLANLAVKLPDTKNRRQK